MWNNQRTITIVVIIALLIVIIIFLSKTSNGNNVEKFTASPYESSKELDTYYQGSTVGVEDYLVDNMTCSPKCCGDQWPVPFDGLSSSEIEKCIENRGKPGPFVRTNYTCANGINGVGCPCIDKKAYLFLVNHGANDRTMGKVEPTFLIRNDIRTPDDEMTPYERLQAKKSMFSDIRKINDLELQREPMSLQNVQLYGSPISAANRKSSALY